MPPITEYQSTDSLPDPPLSGASPLPHLVLLGSANLGGQTKANVAPCIALVRDQWFTPRRPRQYRVAMKQSSHYRVSIRRNRTVLY
ncbi:hypothetical protein FW800_07770 [Pseudomonas sp. 910_23]|nr:hypothetical protein [Pseudomonas sp. NCIMB 10586]